MPSDSTTTRTPAPPAELALGSEPWSGDGIRYRLGEPLGRGGMAVVRQGTDLLLDREVAIKQLAPEYADDADAVALFEAEARQGAKLNHPGVVRIFDSGGGPTSSTGDAAPFIVMELVQGRPLTALMTERGPLPPAEAVRLTDELLEALSHCHAAGVLHGDVNPTNVMVTAEGHLKLLDFGLARSVRRPGVEDAVAGRFGTARYLSPEQARKDVIDARSDLYSTACVLYHLLSGRPPFVGATYSDVAAQHLFCVPAPLSELRPEVGPGFDDLLSRCLSKDPDQRPRSASELRLALERLPARSRSSAVIVPPTPSRERVLLRSAAGSGWARPDNRRLALAAAVAVTLLLPVAAFSTDQGPAALRPPAAAADRGSDAQIAGVADHPPRSGSNSSTVDDDGVSRNHDEARPASEPRIASIGTTSTHPVAVSALGIRSVHTEDGPTRFTPRRNRSEPPRGTAAPVAATESRDDAPSTSRTSGGRDGAVRPGPQTEQPRLPTSGRSNEHRPGNNGRDQSRSSGDRDHEQQRSRSTRTDKAASKSAEKSRAKTAEKSRAKAAEKSGAKAAGHTKNRPGPKGSRAAHPVR